MPQTPDGALAQQIQKAENDYSKIMKLPRVRVVERVGRKLSKILSCSDLWSGASCQRADCLVCPTQVPQSEAQVGQCQTENPLHRMQEC